MCISGRFWACVVIAVGLALADYADASALDEGLPLRPSPCRLAENLEEPERTVHVALAEAMRGSQSSELEMMLGSVDFATKTGHSWRQRYVLGLALALEEYFQMELSYPDCVEQLHASGYLLKEWEQAGLHVVDFTPEVSALDENSVVYVPQPIGEAELINVPGRGCAYTMRCYREYCLALPTRCTEQWGIERTKYLVGWMQPFREFGLIEIMRIDKDNPGASTCVICK